MVTLTTKFGIEWSVVTHNDKVAYYHNNHGICFNYSDKKYHVMRQGNSIFSNASVAVCLERASEIVLDVYATHFKPIWE